VVHKEPIMLTLKESAKAANRVGRADNARSYLI